MNINKKHGIRCSSTLRAGAALEGVLRKLSLDFRQATVARKASSRLDRPTPRIVHLWLMPSWEYLHDRSIQTLLSEHESVDLTSTGRNLVFASENEETKGGRNWSDECMRTGEGDGRMASEQEDGEKNGDDDLFH